MARYRGESGELQIPPNAGYEGAVDGAYVKFFAKGFSTTSPFQQRKRFIASLIRFRLNAEQKGGKRNQLQDALGP